ncbi:MAG: DUF4198 domain-containing protein [Bacillota bacterium]
MRETMLRVVQGHEIWVFPESYHRCRGEETRCLVFYGHAMRPEGSVQEDKLSASAFDPGGECHELRIRRDEKGHHVLRLEPGREGLWAVSVENDVGPIVVTKGGLYKNGTRLEYPDARDAGYYYQYAKNYFIAGHFCAACGDLFKQADLSFLGHELELVMAPRKYQVGDEVVLQVRYRGVLLPEVMVAATWGGWGKNDWAQRFVTNGKGQVKVPLSNSGDWLFYVRHADENRGVPGEYERRIFSATLGLTVVQEG